MVQWSHELLNSKIAPGIATFTAADLPDVAAEFKEASFWMANHFLNTALGVGFKPPLKLRMTTMLVRCATAIRFYGEARAATQAYLTNLRPDSPPVEKYYWALSLWEAVLMNYWIAARTFTKTFDEKAYDAGDGSSSERACSLFNIIKHKAGEKGLTETDEQPVAVWMTNEGLTAGATVLGWSEIAELMRDLGRTADSLQHPGGLVLAQQGASPSSSGTLTLIQAT